MSYLSKIIINKKQAIKHKLSNNYAWHQFAWSFFEPAKNFDRDFLTRLEAKEREFVFYIKSKREPIIRQDPDFDFASKAIPDFFLQHEKYFFDVIANPTRKVHAYTATGERKKNSRREAILDTELQYNWFLAQAEKHGFELHENLLPLEISPAETNIFYKKKAEVVNRVNNISVQFKGLLKVNEREKFKQAFELGLGSAKAFGYGLMLLKPLN